MLLSMYGAIAREMVATPQLLHSHAGPTELHGNDLREIGVREPSCDYPSKITVVKRSFPPKILAIRAGNPFSSSSSDGKVNPSGRWTVSLPSRSRSHAVRKRKPFRRNR